MIKYNRVLPHPDDRRSKEVARHRSRLAMAVRWVQAGCPVSLAAYFKEHGLSASGARKIEKHQAVQQLMTDMITLPAKRGLISVVGKLEEKVRDEELDVLDLTRSGEFLGRAAYEKFSKNEDGLKVQVNINLPEAGGVHLSVEERDQIELEWEKQQRIIDA